jgi:ketosteroid isomerase-like protein
LRGARGGAAPLAAWAAHVDATFAVERLVPAGGHVVALGRLHGTARASGATFDVPATHAWTVRDGLVVRHEAYVDVPALLAALDRNRYPLETTAT